MIAVFHVIQVLLLYYFELSRAAVLQMRTLKRVVLQPRIPISGANTVRVQDSALQLVHVLDPLLHVSQVIKGPAGSDTLALIVVSDSGNRICSHLLAGPYLCAFLMSRVQITGEHGFIISSAKRV